MKKKSERIQRNSTKPHYSLQRKFTDIFRMPKPIKFAAGDAVRMINQDDELSQVHDLRNCLDFVRLDAFQNHEAPVDYVKYGEVGQLLVSMLKIIPYQLTEELELYLKDTEQVHNKNHETNFL